MTPSADGADEKPFPRRFPRRGEIYDFDLGEPRGSAQAGRRPMAVVSNDVNNEHATTVTAVAITRTIPKRPYPFAVDFPAGVLRFDGTILCNQIFTVDKAELLKYRGELDAEQMAEVDRTHGGTRIASSGLPVAFPPALEVPKPLGLPENLGERLVARRRSACFQALQSAGSPGHR